MLALTAAAPLSQDIVITAAPFVAEDVESAPGGRLLVSGVAGRTVLVQQGATFRPWLKPARFAPMGGLFGMAADPARDRLWIAETDGSGVPGASGPRSTAIVEVQLSNGRVLARHAVSSDGKRDRWMGDVMLARDGSVYATDSRGGAIYRLRKGAVERLVATSLESLQGLAETGTGALVVADYATGLHRIDLASGKIAAIDAGTAQLRGIDGLQRDGDTLIATQNGTMPNRVLRLRLGADEASVIKVDELLPGPDRIDDIALGRVIGRRFVFIAHSQWASVGEDGKLAAPPKPARIATISLD